MAIKRDMSDDGWGDPDTPKVVRRENQQASRRSIEKMSTCSRASIRSVPRRTIVTELDGSWDDEQRPDTGKSYSVRSNNRSITLSDTGAHRSNIFGGPKSLHVPPSKEVDNRSVNLIEFSLSSHSNVLVDGIIKPPIATAQASELEYRSFGIPKNHLEKNNGEINEERKLDMQFTDQCPQNYDGFGAISRTNQINTNPMRQSFVREAKSEGEVIPNHLLRTGVTHWQNREQNIVVNMSTATTNTTSSGIGALPIGQRDRHLQSFNMATQHQNTEAFIPPLATSTRPSTPQTRDLSVTAEIKPTDMSLSSHFANVQQNTFAKNNTPTGRQRITISSFVSQSTPESFNNGINASGNITSGFEAIPSTKDKMLDISKTNDFGASHWNFTRNAAKQEEISGFGAFFGTTFQETIAFTPEPTQRANTTVANNCSEMEATSGGFGRPQTPANPDAYFVRNTKEDQRPGPSTFVPPEENVERLFLKRSSPGEGFESLFNTDIEIIRGDLKRRTRLEKMTTFDNIHLTEQIRTNLRTCKYENPTPVQQHTMPLISAGNDILACAQTGSGKTGAFLIPIISNLLETRDFSSMAETVCLPRCLILAPTRELTIQLYNEARQFGFGYGNNALNIKHVYGGTCVEYQRKELSRGATILVATIGRFMQYLDEGSISLEKVKFLVLDEADRMLDLGFHPAIKKIIDNPSLPSAAQRQTLMFSATFPTDLQVIAQDLMKPNYVMITVDKLGIACRSVKQEFILCDATNKLENLLSILNIRNYKVDEDSAIFKIKTIIFVQNKLFADTLAAILCEARIPCTTIHSSKIQQLRDEAMREFTSGRKAVLIATGLAERGLDIKGVDLIINYDLPKDIDTYVHRIGRTGRIGHSGHAISLYTNQDSQLAPALVQVLKDVGQEVPPFLQSSCETANNLSHSGVQIDTW